MTTPAPPLDLDRIVSSMSDPDDGAWATKTIHKLIAECRASRIEINRLTLMAESDAAEILSQAREIGRLEAEIAKMKAHDGPELCFEDFHDTTTVTP